MSYNIWSSNSALFSSSGSSLFGNTDSSLFGSLSSSIGDYSLIRSGVYKKLLNSYYKNVEETDSTSESSTSESESTGYRITSAVELDALKTGKTSTTLAGTAEDTSTLSSIKTATKGLADAASALSSNSLYEAEELEDGTQTDVTESVRTALQNYVTAYNTYREQVSETDNNSILNKDLTILKANSANSSLLKKIGITTGNNGELVFDETKVDSSTLSTVQSLFQGSGSYGDTVMDAANESYRIANSATYNTGSGSSYSTSGTYSVLGTTSSILDQYL